MRKSTIVVIFRGILALVISLWTLCYLWHVTFVPDGMILSPYTEIIVGFVLGTGIGTILGYYFSNQDELNGRRRKTDELSENADITSGSKHTTDNKLLNAGIETDKQDEP